MEARPGKTLWRPRAGRYNVIIGRASAADRGRTGDFPGRAGMDESQAAMGLSVRRFPEFNVSVVVMEGVIAAEAFVAFVKQLDLGGVTRWLNYTRPGTDLTNVDLLSMTQVKRTFGERLRMQLQGGSIRSAFVCDSHDSEAVVRLWTAYVGRDDDYPSTPVICPSLEAAFDYLGLSPEAREAVADAIGRAPRPDAQREAQRP
jgi:hypothetical protein